MSTEWKIPLYKIYTDDEDLRLITKIIRRGTNWAIGPEIEEFEEALKNYVGAEYCLTLNSGTSALHACLLAYGIGRNDEILTTPFTFISTVNSILFVNGIPKFVDIESETLGMNPDLIKQSISSKTKCVMPVDVGGLPCSILEIKKIAKQMKLTLIEDAAESLGSSINGQKIGSISDSTIFSFCGNKVLTTGEGGAIVTNSKQIYEKIRLIRSHGRIGTTSYFNDPNPQNYVEIGYNWRMSSITASLGISQLQKLDKIIQMRKNNAQKISDHLSKLNYIEPPTIPKGYDHVFQMYTIRLPNKEVRDELKIFLLKKRIFCKVYFEPIHLIPFYQNKYGFHKGDMPITEQMGDRVLTIPVYPNMNSEEMDFLLNSMSEFSEIQNSK